VLPNQRTLKLVSSRLSTHDEKDLILESPLTVGTDALLQQMRPVFHDSMIDVLLPTSRKALPIGPTLADRETDVLLARDRIGEPIDQVITIVPALAPTGLASGFGGLRDVNSHISIIAPILRRLNHYFPLENKGMRA